MPKWLHALIGTVFVFAVSFGAWAATSIYSIQTRLAVQDTDTEHIKTRQDDQQGTINTFQSSLGRIETAIEVIRSLMEEREKNAVAGTRSR